MRFTVFLGVVLGLLVFAGCAAPPVQAMSNARQAIHAAEAAGAQRYAPGQLAEARHWLDDAEFALDGDDYARARASAAKAVDAAQAAANQARSARANAPSSTPVPASAERGFRSRISTFKR